MNLTQCNVTQCVEVQLILSRGMGNNVTELWQIRRGEGLRCCVLVCIAHRTHVRLTAGIVVGGRHRNKRE